MLYATQCIHVDVLRFARSGYRLHSLFDEESRGPGLHPILVARINPVGCNSLSWSVGASVSAVGAACDGTGEGFRVIDIKIVQPFQGWNCW